MASVQEDIEIDKGGEADSVELQVKNVYESGRGLIPLQTAGEDKQEPD